MPKKIISRYLIFIAAFTSFTIFAFMVESSYSNLMGPINKNRSNTLIKPIDTNLDSGFIRTIESRKVYPILVSTASSQILPTSTP